MTPLDALADGRPDDAVALQRPVVEASPADPAARLLLVELLAVAARHREALAELKLVASADPAWPAARRRFARLLIAAHRREAGRRPTFLTDPPPHARHRARAWRSADPDRAVRHTDRADANAPHVLGHIDGREFDGLRDADERLATVLEAFVGREYVWVPFEHLRRLSLRPAAHVLDRAFRPATLLLSDWRQVRAFVPCVYPASATAGGAFAAGLETDMVNPDGGPTRCVGAKVWLAGEEEVSVADVRQLDVRAWA